MRIAIIGGGAAGHFAAIRAKQTNPQAEVTIFEAAPRVLAKVSVTGGGRCNLTNTFADITDLRTAYPRGFRLMKRLFNRFGPADTVEWFESHGVRLVVQPDQCLFPESQSAQSIVDCLTSNVLRLGVRTQTEARLVGLEASDNSFRLSFGPDGARKAWADRVVVTSGGHSSPVDFEMFRALGHTIEPPTASLFTFNIADERLRDLMGTVVEQASVSIVGQKMSASGPLLVTHWGLSGPAILKLSSYGARWTAEQGYSFDVAVSWLGQRSAQQVGDELTAHLTSNSAKQIGNVRPFGLTARLWTWLLQRCDMPTERRCADIGRKAQNKLVETLTNDTYHVSGKSRWKDEFVTCGGISLSSIDPNTLESRTTPGLFFAGEVTDVDAITGGFNLQAAWTMGFVAGEAAARR